MKLVKFGKYAAMAHKIHVERSHVRLNPVFKATPDLQTNCGRAFKKRLQKCTPLSHCEHRFCLSNSITLKARFTSPLPHSFAISDDLESLKFTNRLNILLPIYVAGRQSGDEED